MPWPWSPEGCKCERASCSDRVDGCKQPTPPGISSKRCFQNLLPDTIEKQNCLPWGISTTRYSYVGLLLRAGAPALAAAGACVIEHMPAQGLHSWHPGSVALSHTHECQGKDTAKLRAVAFPSGLPQCSLRAGTLGNHSMGLALPGLCQRAVLCVP